MYGIQYGFSVSCHNGSYIIILSISVYIFSIKFPIIDIIYYHSHHFQIVYVSPKATLNIKYSHIHFLSLATNIGAINLWYLLYYARVSVVVVVLLLCVLTCQVCASLIIINTINNLILLSISIINDLYSVTLFVVIFWYKFFS